MGVFCGSAVVTVSGFRGSKYLSCGPSIGARRLEVLLRALTTPAFLVAAFVLAGCGGSTTHAHAATTVVGRGKTGTLAAAPARSILPGTVLIADRGNNRLLMVDERGRIVWEFPRPGDLRPDQ